jgi:hypothetical protein
MADEKKETVAAKSRPEAKKAAKPAAPKAGKARRPKRLKRRRTLLRRKPKKKVTFAAPMA